MRKRFHIVLILAPVLGVVSSCGTWPGPVKDPVSQVDPEPVAPVKPETAPFVDPDEGNVSELGPYFEDVFGGEAHLALAENRIEDAMRGFDEIALNVEDPVLTPRARFLAAYLARRLGDNARALDELPGLASQLPLLADTAWETAAKSAYSLHKWERAARLARKISPRSSLSPSGDLIIADCLRRAGRFQEGAQAYRAYLSAHPEAEVAQARSRLVECISEITSAAEAPDPVLVQDGLDQIDILRAQSPLGKWTRTAVKREAILLKASGQPPRAASNERQTALKAYDKAVKLKNKMRNREAEKAYNKVLKLARKNGRLACKARLDKGIVVVRQRAHGKAAQIFQEVAQDCTDPNIRVKAMLQGGKAFFSASRYEEAISLFGMIEEEFSEHSYADDARLHIARCHLAMGDEETFRDHISTLPELYPAGDMRAEALWIGAHEALKSEAFEEARNLLKKYHELFPSERGWYAAGRSGYWLGRVHEILGDTKSAAETYEKVIASSPLSHYMVMAHSRLHTMDAERARELILALAPPGGTLSTTFSRSLVDEHPPFASGIELLRMGLTTRGRRELTGVLNSQDSPAQFHWLAAALFRRVGNFSMAREATSNASDNWMQRYPSGAELARWTLAYPTAFEEEVEEASRESGVEKSLLWAVMREESGFNARVESWANAIGLMQLIMPTAKAMGRKLDIKVKRKTLKEPKTNIRLGAAYLAYLSDLFDDHPVLVIAGYNAGEGAVRKWVKDKRDTQIDMFVEEIPYKQTRGYTKRVMSSLAAYKFLYDENRPVVTPPMALP